tara:strand:- start:84 stop:323 length:240 start_codon:yes stop_codon:yes gene_type:complete
MSSNLLFLIGTVVLAIVGSLTVRLFTRPRSRPAGPEEVQRALRKMSQHQPRNYGSDGVRMVEKDDSTDESRGPTVLGNE